MKGPDSGNSLLSAIISGGEKAVSEFSKISGGEWFDEAPEYFLTTYVASSIKSLKSTYSLLEVSVKQARKEAGASRFGRPANKERRNGRFDIVVYWANDKPRGAIEVKSPISSVTIDRIQPDIEKMCSAITANKDSSFQFCAFVYYASVAEPERKHNNASRRLRELLKRINTLAKDAAGKFMVDTFSIEPTVHRGEDDDGGAWCVNALIFTRKGGKQSFIAEK